MVIAVGSGFLIAGAVGWAFDPHDRRDGGIVEWDSYEQAVRTGRQLGTNFYHWNPLGIASGGR